MTTFGLRESMDCLDWVEFAISRFGPDCRLILTGISMGASTVLLAAGQPLPPQVAGVLADCGYTSAREIIETVLRKLCLPVRLFYPLSKLATRFPGGFDLEQAAPVEALRRCKIPVIFFTRKPMPLFPVP